LHHVALSISFLSPIARGPDAFSATNIASLILRPDLRFLGSDLFPEPQPSQLEFRKLLPNFSPQAIFFRFAPALTASRKHP
jgi:hypothetical protein